MEKRFANIEQTKVLFERKGMFTNAKFGALSYKYDGASVVAATNTVSFGRLENYDLKALEIRTYQIELTKSHCSLKSKFPFNDVQLAHFLNERYVNESQ